MSTPHVIIVGGGIVGCACAHAMAQVGLQQPKSQGIGMAVGNRARPQKQHQLFRVLLKGADPFRRLRTIGRCRGLGLG